MPKMTVGQTRGKDARHVEENLEMNFLFVHMHVVEGMMIWH